METNDLHAYFPRFSPVKRDAGWRMRAIDVFHPSTLGYLCNLSPHMNIKGRMGRAKAIGREASSICPYSPSFLSRNYGTGLSGVEREWTPPWRKAEIGSGVGMWRANTANNVISNGPTGVSLERKPLLHIRVSGSVHYPIPSGPPVDCWELCRAGAGETRGSRSKRIRSAVWTVSPTVCFGILAQRLDVKVSTIHSSAGMRLRHGLLSPHGAR